MTEAELQALVIELARWRNFAVYHTHDSRRSQPGFPDLVLVHRATGRTLYRELKVEKGRLTPAQREWLDYLGRRNDVGVWRPSDWTSGAIRDALTANATAVTA